MNSTFTMATYVCLSTSYVCVSLNSPHICVCPLPTYGCLSTRYICVFVHSPHMGVYPLTTYVCLSARHICVHVPSQELEFKCHMLWFFSMFNDLM